MITSEIITIITNKIGIPEKNICQGVATDLNTFSQEFKHNDFIIWFNRNTLLKKPDIKPTGVKNENLTYTIAVYQINRNIEIDSLQSKSIQNEQNCIDVIETLCFWLKREYGYKTMNPDIRPDHKNWIEKHTGVTANITGSRTGTQINIIDVNC